MVCLLSSHGVAFVVMKNCDPFEFGPALAMLTEYGLRKTKAMFQRSGSPQPAFYIPIVLQIVRKLVLKIAVPDARPAGAVSERVACLDHELGDDTVEDDAVVVRAPRVADEVFHCLGSLLREQPEVHVTQRRVDRRGGCERRRARRCGRRGGGDCLFLARRALIEDVAVAGFRAAVSVENRHRRGPNVKVRTRRKREKRGSWRSEMGTYSGSLRVNM